MATVSLWKTTTNQELRILEERVKTDIVLPVATGYDDIEIELISGRLPPGMRISGISIVGTPFEVVRDTAFTFVLRATWCGNFDDRTFTIKVIGPDAPEWRTPSGLLPVGTNGLLFVLDNQLIDFSLFAVDTDLPAGDELTYFIAEGDGMLPDGLTLTSDGRIYGITEPLLSLEERYRSGRYDTMPFGTVFDYAVLPNNGFSSFLYDTQTFDFAEFTQSFRKLNRYWPFAVTVTDGDSFVRREFRIYVVGDDYLRADNTVESAGTTMFTADNTFVRTPIWLTPRNLGTKRANNYLTIPLQIIDDASLTGTVTFTLNDVTSDGSPSELPPGMVIDGDTGILHGRVPYQPAITKNYKFAITATRVEGDLENVQVIGTFYEDTLLGATEFKINKLDLTDEDGVNDLLELVGRDILLNNQLYRVTGVFDDNDDFDIIYVDNTLGPNISLIVSRRGLVGTDYLFVNRLTNSQAEKYLNRTLKLSVTEEYVIQNITPYLVYKVESSNFPSMNTAITKFAEDYGGNIYINDEEPGVWYISIRSTSQSRNIGNVRDTLIELGVLDARVSIFKDNEDRLQFNVNLTKNINQGRNIGIALFEGDQFREDIVIATNDDVAMPSSTRTFELSIIGEIDSAISWITPSDLGSIKANLPSIFKVEAESAVASRPIKYELTSGKLPNGMYLSSRGTIIGAANQYETDTLKGLTKFDNYATTWDNLIANETTFDRVFEFTIKATDTVGQAEISRTFRFRVIDDDANLYTDLFLKPLLKPAQRQLYTDFISDASIFTPSSIYRPSDPNFGVQRQIQMLAYAGIEAKKIEEFVAAAAKNHKRRRYKLGDFRKAIARIPGTNEVVYEVIYIEVIDPANPVQGKSRTNFKIDTKNKITVDSIQYHPVDDNSGLNQGTASLPFTQIDNDVEFILIDQTTVIISTVNQGNVTINFDNDFTFTLQNDEVINIVVNLDDADPYRLRPTPKENTIKADSNAIKISDAKDQLKYLSNIQNMRDRIKVIGATDGDYLPLWMQTPQDNLQELGYKPAIPVCYCKPGTADDILLNIRNNGFDPKQIDFDIDRYIIERTEDYDDSKFIVFANYQFNV